MAVTMPKPMYTVLFNAESYDPEVEALPLGDPEELARSTWPHGLDLDVAPALPALWYCLHLPKTAWDVVDLPLPGVRETLNEERKHVIVLAPVQAFLDWSLRLPSGGPEPMLVIGPDDAYRAISALAADFGYVLPAVKFSDLSQESLSAHWEA